MLTLKIFLIIYLLISLNLIVTIVYLFKTNKFSKIILFMSLSYTLICILLSVTTGELMDEYIFENNTPLFFMSVIIVLLQLIILIKYVYRFKNKN